MERISVDPKICHGKPHIKGTRIAIHIILDLLGAGETFDSILQIYPHITKADILACIKYGTVLAQTQKFHSTNEILYLVML